MDLRQPLCAGRPAFGRCDGGPLPGPPSDAGTGPAPGLEAGVRRHHPAGCDRAGGGKPPGPPVPALASECGLGDGYTYIRTRTGWTYLAAVLDLFNRKVVGWSMSRRLDAELACSALRMALQSRQPEPGLLVHSDQGCQYTSDAWRRLLAQQGARASRRRRGNCWDNAVAERFFLSLKMERVWRRDYANDGEATRGITDYIVGFYNERRMHSTLGYLSPNAYERKWTAEPPIEVSEITCPLHGACMSRTLNYSRSVGRREWAG